MAGARTEQEIARARERVGVRSQAGLWVAGVRRGIRIRALAGLGVIGCATALERCYEGSGLRCSIFCGDRVFWRVLVALLVVGMCVVLLFGASTAAAMPGAAAPQSAATARTAWKGCGKGFQCARVRVPLDWSNPTGPQISLAVIRHRASGPGRRIGSVFLNWGGPSGRVLRT